MSANDPPEAPATPDPSDIFKRTAEASPVPSDTSDLLEAPAAPVPSDILSPAEASASPAPSDTPDLLEAPAPPAPSDTPDLLEAPASPVPSDTPRSAPDLHAGLAAPLFQTEECGPRLRVVTPFALPDGDLLVVFVLRHSDPPLLGDLGETLRWLRSHTSAARRSEGLQQRILDICTGLGVELERGELRTHTRPDEPLALALVRLAQTCLRVAELWRSFRPRPASALLDEIDAGLRSGLTVRPLSIGRGERIAGISATTWSVDFRVRTPARHTLLFVLASERREHARKLAEHVVAACTDLAHLRKLRRTPVQFIAVFDDRGEAWSDAEARLVAPFATPYKWSDRATWIPMLATPLDTLEEDYEDEDDEDDPDDSEPDREMDDVLPAELSEDDPDDGEPDREMDDAPPAELSEDDPDGGEPDREMDDVLPAEVSEDDPEQSD